MDKLFDVPEEIGEKLWRLSIKLLAEQEEMEIKYELKKKVKIV